MFFKFASRLIPLFLLQITILLSTAVTAPAMSAEAAADFSLPVLANQSAAKDSSQQVRLGDLKGRVVYLDFWATWCPPCRKSFPWMDEMQAQYGDQGLTVVAVSVDKKPELIEKFIAQLEPHFIVAHDPSGSVAKTYKLRAMPTSYLIDREGRLVKTHMGFRSKDRDKLENEIKALLEQ
jgi:thiol-disulfide isomerase/thioredoxin